MYAPWQLAAQKMSDAAGVSDGEGLACIPAEWSSRHREEALRSPGLWPYLVWVVRGSSKST